MCSCSQQRKRSSCNDWSSAGFPFLRTSGEMPLIPETFPHVRQSMAFLSCVRVDSVSSLFMTNRSGNCVQSSVGNGVLSCDDLARLEREGGGFK
ncbi:hypothetical protein CHS0354_018888, partial [Potamilus streckersoni]